MTRFAAFAKYWDFKPRACVPNRPQTMGKNETAVGVVKTNAITGAWDALAGWLAGEVDRGRR